MLSSFRGLRGGGGDVSIFDGDGIAGLKVEGRGWGRLGTSRAGEWLVSLGLGENSSPAWVDGRLYCRSVSPTVVDARSTVSGPAGDAPRLASAAQAPTLWQTTQCGVAPHQDYQLPNLSWWTRTRNRCVARQGFVRSERARDAIVGWWAMTVAGAVPARERHGGYAREFAHAHGLAAVAEIDVRPLRNIWSAFALSITPVN
jgi:hypothetical protein